MGNHGNTVWRGCTAIGQNRCVDAGDIRFSPAPCPPIARSESLADATEVFGCVLMSTRLSFGPATIGMSWTPEELSGNYGEAVEIARLQVTGGAGGNRTPE